MFDFSELDLDALSERGAWLDIVDPRTLQRTGARMCVLGPYSERVRKRELDIATAPRLASISDVDSRMAKFAADSVVAWEGVVWQGAPMEFSRESALTLFGHSRFAREQVLNFQGDRSNFLGK